MLLIFFFFFFFNDTATTEIYTLSLHDALPIYLDRRREAGDKSITLVILVALERLVHDRGDGRALRHGDHASTRLRSFSGDGHDLGPLGFRLGGRRGRPLDVRGPRGLVRGRRFRVTGTDREERRVGKECRSRWSPYH